jgi:hypothetical protein
MRDVKSLQTGLISCLSLKLRGPANRRLGAIKFCGGRNLKNVPPSVETFRSHIGLSSDASAGLWIKALSWLGPGRDIFDNPWKTLANFFRAADEQTLTKENKAVDYT